MFEETSLLKEFARFDELYLTGFRAPTRWIVGGLAFFLIGSSALYAQVWQGAPGTSLSWFDTGNCFPKTGKTFRERL